MAQGLGLLGEGRLDGGPGQETLVPGVKVWVLAFGHHGGSLVAKDEGQHVVPWDEGDVRVGAVLLVSVPF